MFDNSRHNAGYIFCSVDKLAGLSFNGGLMFVGLVPVPYNWHDFIKYRIDEPIQIELFLVRSDETWSDVFTWMCLDIFNNQIRYDELNIIL